MSGKSHRQRRGHVLCMYQLCSLLLLYSSRLFGTGPRTRLVWDACLDFREHIAIGSCLTTLQLLMRSPDTMKICLEVRDQVATLAAASTTILRLALLLRRLRERIASVHSEEVCWLRRMPARHIHKRRRGDVVGLALSHQPVVL